jgi:lactate 2-monooxygenase
MIFSNQASVPMEAASASLGPAPAVPRWFQLYWSSDDEFVQSLLSRAEKAGCEAIVLTLDTTLLGWRPRDLDAASLPFLLGQGLAQYLTDPVFRAKIPARPPVNPVKPRGGGVIGALLKLRAKGRAYGLSVNQMRGAVARFTQTYSRPDLNWSDVKRLRAMTKLPIILKGIRHPDDAARAAQEGVDGIIVSNHGGRQVDGEAGTLDVLPSIVAAAGAMPVLLDSGVRTGSDIFKAMALGARAVLVGRPYVYGLAIAGENGVREVIQNLVAEFDITMALAGCTRCSEISAECLRPND